MRAGRHSQVGQGRTLPHSGGQPVLHPPPLRPQHRLPLFPALPLGPGRRQGVRAKRLWAQADRRDHAEGHRRRRRLRVRLAGPDKPPRQSTQRVFVNRGSVPPRMPPAPNAKDIGVGEVASGKNWQVTSALAEHAQPWLDSLAYRVDTPEGSVVFTGDTQPCDTARELARDADMMLCMCWDDQAVMESVNESEGQCGTTGAAQLAQDAGVKKLVLIHMGPSLSKDTPFERHVDEMTRMYDGEIIFSEELMRIEV
ncbi:MAG TPA: hypothetical protein EYM42_07525 [Dehalococcoidia bacterium]|nr:hypothetical protein [Dehalococcoidia bacterium]